MKFHRVLSALLIGIISQFPSSTVFAAKAEEKWKLEKVVIVMRHGVRPPTKEKPVPDGITTNQWPKWDVPYGYLTQHGGQAIQKIAEFDKAQYKDLLPKDCASASQFRIIADTDERTLSTGRIWGQTIIPNCDIKVENAGGDNVDERFSPFAAQKHDGAAMMKAAEAALPKGGFEALNQKYLPLLKRIDEITGCCQTNICPPQSAKCGLGNITNSFTQNEKGRVKLSGGLDIASTVSHVLLLEYADGKPMNEVGWGKVSADDIRALSAFHALEFDLISRPKAIADIGAQPLFKDINSAFDDNKGAKVTLFVGHDGNIANIDGAFKASFIAGDLAPRDPSPGGAIIFEKWRSGNGKIKVVTRYRSQTLDEIRYLKPLGTGASKILKMPLCGNKDYCDYSEFKKITVTK